MTLDEANMTATLTQAELDAVPVEFFPMCAGDMCIRVTRSCAPPFETRELVVAMACDTDSSDIRESGVRTKQVQLKCYRIEVIG